MTEQLKLRLEREDKEDGSITYHLWTDAGDWIVGLNDDETRQGGNARSYANTIVRAVNAHETLAKKLDNCVHALTFAIDGWDESDPYIIKLRATRDAAAKALADLTA